MLWWTTSAPAISFRAASNPDGCASGRGPTTACRADSRWPAEATESGSWSPAWPSPRRHPGRPGPWGPKGPATARKSITRMPPKAVWAKAVEHAGRCDLATGERRPRLSGGRGGAEDLVGVFNSRLRTPDGAGVPSRWMGTPSGGWRRWGRPSPCRWPRSGCDGGRPAPAPPPRPCLARRNSSTSSASHDRRHPLSAPDVESARLSGNGPIKVRMSGASSRPMTSSRVLTQARDDMTEMCTHHGGAFEEHRLMDAGG